MIGSSVNYLPELSLDRHFLGFAAILGPPMTKAYLLVLHVIGKTSIHPLVLKLALDLPVAVSAFNVIYSFNTESWGCLIFNNGNWQCLIFNAGNLRCWPETCFFAKLHLC